MKKLAIPDIPRPRDVLADIADIEAKLGRFAARTRELEAERNALELANASANMSPATTPRDARVAALLGETNVAADLPSRARLVDIVVELADLREATEAAHRMRRVALTRASAIVCATVAPQYRERVRAVVDAMKAAHAATAELYEFTDMLSSQEVEWTGLGVAFPSFLGHPRDVDGRLAFWLREMVDQGHIAKHEIPKELQPK